MYAAPSPAMSVERRTLGLLRAGLIGGGEEVADEDEDDAAGLDDAVGALVLYDAANGR